MQNTPDGWSNNKLVNENFTRPNFLFVESTLRLSRRKAIGNYLAIDVFFPVLIDSKNVFDFVSPSTKKVLLVFHS